MAQLFSLGIIRTLLVKLFLSLLGILAFGAGCKTGDEQFRDRVVGTWRIETATVIYRHDGSFQFENSAGQYKWRNSGTWLVKDGYLINKITNSWAENTSVKAPVGRVGHSKITFVDTHKLVTLDNSGICTLRR